MKFKELANTNKLNKGKSYKHVKDIFVNPIQLQGTEGKSGALLLFAAQEAFKKDAIEDITMAMVKAEDLKDLSTPHHDADTYKNTAALYDEMARRLQGLLEWFSVEQEAAWNPYFRTTESATQEVPSIDELPKEARQWLEGIQNK